MVQADTGPAEIVLFHSVLGVRAGVSDAADRFRAAGHQVHVVDLYEGVRFDDYDDGAAHVESLGGAPELMRRTTDSIAHRPAGVVYAGFSNGGGSAVYAALSRPGARGVLAFHAAMPLSMLGADAWPADVPVQVHYAEHDPFRQPEWVEQFGASVRASGARYEFFDYPGVHGHLFSDPSREQEYDPAAAELMFERALAFLRRV